MSLCENLISLNRVALCLNCDAVKGMLTFRIIICRLLGPVFRGVKFSSTFLFLLFKSTFSDNLPSNHPIVDKKNEIKFTLYTFIYELNNN